MTVNPRVNPKKLRPYDEPPKRRRSLIPDAPDSAATGFFVAAAIWLAVATGIGLAAIALRVVQFQMSIPLGFFDLSVEVDGRRVDAAFANATVFGWLSNAFFAAIAFMLPRLTGRRLALEKLLILAVLIWNSALAGGVALLFVFDIGVNGPFTALPWFVEGGLATAAFIVTAAFVATAAAELRAAYVSVWFAGVALLGLLGLTGLASLVGILDAFFGLDGVPVGLASAFIGRALATMWLLGMTFAVLHYVVPRASAQPLASGGVAFLTFLTWIALAPVAALGTLADTSVPFVVTTLGAVATMLLIVPVGLAVGNLAGTLQGRWSLVLGIGPAAIATASLAFLLGTSLLEAIGSLRAVDAFVSGTDWETGAFVWAMYGAFTLAAFALAEHALPRILRRAWGGSHLTAAQVWLAFGGAALAGTVLIGGGLAEGSLVAAGTPPDDLSAQLLVYRAAAFASFGLVALAGVAMLANLFLIYTSAEPVEYVVPGQSAPATAGH